MTKEPKLNFDDRANMQDNMVKLIKILAKLENSWMLDDLILGHCIADSDALEIYKLFEEIHEILKEVNNVNT